MSNTAEKRADAWAQMLAMAGTHDQQVIVNPKTRPNEWQKERAARDMRTADEVFRTPFNQVRRQI